MSAAGDSLKKLNALIDFEICTPGCERRELCGGVQPTPYCPASEQAHIFPVPYTCELQRCESAGRRRPQSLLCKFRHLLNESCSQERGQREPSPSHSCHFAGFLRVDASFHVGEILFGRWSFVYECGCPAALEVEKRA